MFLFCNTKYAIIIAQRANAENSMLTRHLLNVSLTGVSYNFRMMILSFHQHSIPPNIDPIHRFVIISPFYYLKLVFEITHFNSQTHLIANEQSVRVMKLKILQAQ
jgi:hypothetical protein